MKASMGALRGARGRFAAAVGGAFALAMAVGAAAVPAQAAVVPLAVTPAADPVPIVGVPQYI